MNYNSFRTEIADLLTAENLAAAKRFFNANPSNERGLGWLEKAEAARAELEARKAREAAGAAARVSLASRLNCIAVPAGR